MLIGEGESLKPLYKILLLILESLQFIHAWGMCLMQSAQSHFVLAGAVKARVQGEQEAMLRGDDLILVSDNSQPTNDGNREGAAECFEKDD